MMGRRQWGHAVSCLMLTLLHTSPSSSVVYVTPHHALLSSSLDLRPASSGLQLATSSLAALESVLAQQGTNLSSSSRHLLESVTRSGRFRLARVGEVLARLGEGAGGRASRGLEEGAEGRVRRGLPGPLSSVGGLAGWAFGLVTHDTFQAYKTGVDDGLEELQKDGQQLHAAVEDNTQALKTSLAALQKFEGWVNQLLEANDALVSSERFVLKILRLRVELDTCLGSLEGLAAVLEEVLDRGDLGLASRYLFHPTHLSHQLLLLNDRHPGLSPLYTARDASNYLRLPLALTSFNSTHLLSILTIPMVDPDSVFHEEEQDFHDGFVVLRNFKYSIFLTLGQYEECTHDARTRTSLCSLRPCLVSPNAREQGSRCFSLGPSTFLLVPGVGSGLRVECGATSLALAATDHLSLPPHCRLASHSFTIKQVTVSPLLEPDTPVSSTIFAVQPEGLLVQQAGGHHKVSIRVEAVAILRHLNTSLHPAHKVAPPAPHTLPLALAGSGLGSLAVCLAGVLLLLLLLRR